MKLSLPCDGRVRRMGTRHLLSGARHLPVGCGDGLSRGGSMVEKSLGVLKNWSQWVVGQSPLPDRRSKIMLGSVLAVGAILAVGLIPTIGSHTAKGNHPTGQPASIATALPCSAGSATPTTTTPA